MHLAFFQKLWLLNVHYSLQNAQKRAVIKTESSELFEPSFYKNKEKCDDEGIGIIDPVQK